MDAVAAAVGQLDQARLRVDALFLDDAYAATAETLEAMETMKDLGFLVGKGGMHGNVYRFKPPMCWTMEDADFSIDVMDHALAKL